MGEPLLLQTSNPTRLPGIENSVEDSNYAPSPEKSMPRKGFSDVLKRFKDKRGHGGQSVHFSRSAGHIENPTTFSIRGGGGDGSIAANLEYRRPLENSNFDLSFRGFLVETKQDGNNYYYTYYRYTRWHWYYRKVYYDWEETQTDYGVESFLLWTPFRGRTFEPFAGIGARYESANYSYDESVRRGRSHESSDSGACLVGRLGLKLSLGKVFLTGEYIVGGKVGDFDGTSEFIGDVGFYLTQRMQMHLFVESLKMDLGSGTAFGGGLSFDF